MGRAERSSRQRSAALCTLQRSRKAWIALRNSSLCIHILRQVGPFRLLNICRGMQNCFRQHPDIYGAELDDDNDITADEHYDSIPPAAAATSSSEGASQSDISSPPILRAEKVTDDTPHHKPSPKHELEAKRERARATTKRVKGEHEPQSESDEVVSRAWHDGVNNEKRS